MEARTRMLALGCSRSAPLLRPCAGAEGKPEPVTSDDSIGWCEPDAIVATKLPPDWTLDGVGQFVEQLEVVGDLGTWIAQGYRDHASPV